MALPASWVDGLFARLTTRYGEAFLRQYGDLDPAAVKADWADVLDGVSGEAIGYALRYLPAERPPNAMQFRDNCRRAPAAETPKLPAPKQDPARVSAILESLKQSTAATMAEPALKCAAYIRDIVQRRGYITEPQRQQLEAIDRMLIGRAA